VCWSCCAWRVVSIGSAGAGWRSLSASEGVNVGLFLVAVGSERFCIVVVMWVLAFLWVVPQDLLVLWGGMRRGVMRGGL